MAKAKRRSTSAAQRREQVRTQREQRLSAGPNKNTRGRGSRRSQAKGTPWLFVAGILVVVAIVIGIFIVIGNQQGKSTTSSGSSSTATSSDPAAASAFTTLTSIDQHTLATIGTGNATNSLAAVKGQPIWKGQDGKPVFFYMGGEFCPYCAAQRWGMVVALSRFGTFNQPLTPITSSEDNISTFSFYKSSYTSKYIDLDAKEVSDNQGQQLEQLTSEENQIVQRYNVPPYVPGSSGTSIPFISVANQEVAGGSFYQPQTVIGLSYQDISNQLGNPSSNVAKGILGTANYLTAAICQVTNNQPANVCTADPIPHIQSSLPKASVGAATTRTGVVDNQLAMVTRRQD